MAEIQQDDIDFIKEYYVYELYDRRHGDAVFYVGEGVKERANQHLKDSLRNLKVREQIRQDIEDDPTLGGKLESAKMSRIQEIIEAGREKLGVRVIGRFDSKEEAKAVETVLINWIYGIDNLTNINRGRGVSHVRPKDQPTDELGGLDIPKQRKVRIFGEGEVEASEIENHKKHGHLQMAETIAEYLRQEYPDISVDDPCFWESGRYVGVFVTLVPGHVRMIIQLTEADQNQHVYNLKPMSEGKQDVKIFSEFLKEGYPEITLKKGGRYAKLPDWIGVRCQNTDLSTISRHVGNALRFFA